MPKDVPLAYLDTLVAIADGGSFEAAAQRLSRTQSAVSQRVRKLEEMVGTKLLVTVGRRRELTRAGETLAQVGRQIHALAENALLEVGRAGGNEVVRIGAPSDLVNSVLHDVLTQMHRTYPGVRVDVHVLPNCQMLDAFREGLLDIALTSHEAPSGPGDLVVQIPCQWIAATDYVHQPDKPLPLVITQGRCSFRRLMISTLEAAQIPYTERATSPMLEGVRAAVYAGMGVTVRTRPAFPGPVQILTEKDGMPPLPSISYYAYHRAEDAPHAVRAMVRLLHLKTIVRPAAMRVKGTGRAQNVTHPPTRPISKKAVGDGS